MPQHDGFVELRDHLGDLWAEYNPATRELRRVRPHRDGRGSTRVAIISLDALVAGDVANAITRTYTEAPARKPTT